MFKVLLLSTFLLSGCVSLDKYCSSVKDSFERRALITGATIYSRTDVDMCREHYPKDWTDLNYDYKYYKQ